MPNKQSGRFISWSSTVIFRRRLAPALATAGSLWLLLSAVRIILYYRSDDCELAFGPSFEEEVAVRGGLRFERYTATHKTLPPGIKLLISYGDNSVGATVNDRRLYVKSPELNLLNSLHSSSVWHGSG